MLGITVAINAQIPSGSGHGGIETLIRSLVAALGKLQDGNEQYVIIGHHDDPYWLQPHIGEHMRIVAAPKPTERFSGRTPQVARPFLFQIRKALINIIGGDMLDTYPHLPVSNGFYESLGVDVIHFPYQSYVICGLPSLYNPHDLQHKHYPSFFTAKELRAREVLYHGACNYTQAITVASQWLKDDLIAQYALSPTKIQVIPLAPFTAAYTTESENENIVEAYQLPETYMLYPAVTWVHKNHLRLLDAMAMLRDEYDVRVHLVCTGSLNAYYHSSVQPHIERLGLQDQVQFLDHVPGDALRALYRHAHFVIHTSLFEASSSMIWEAAQEGIAAIASDIPTIREQAGAEAVLFDPLDVTSIAETIRRVMTDDAYRESIAAYGKERLKVFSWERTARAYRAMYRKLAHVPLTDEDQRLLNWNWMQDGT